MLKVPPVARLFFRKTKKEPRMKINDSNLGYSRGRWEESGIYQVPINVLPQ